MKKSWTAGASPEEKKRTEAEYSSAVALRAKLTELLEKDIALTVKEGRSKGPYSSPNWALLQADANGYLRALDHVISLIK